MPKAPTSFEVICLCGEKFTYAHEQYGTTPNVKRNCGKCGAVVVFSTDNARIVDIAYQGAVKSDLVEGPSLFAASGAVHNDLRETLTCINAGAYRACALMSRRCLEAALKERGCKGEDLEDLIDDALQKGLLKSEDLTVAHAVRLIGNKGAHQTIQGGTSPPGAAPLQQRLFSADFFKKFDNAKAAFGATEGLLRVLYNISEPTS